MLDAMHTHTQAPQPTLYYDASCGMCQREIDHLRPRLEASGIKLTDISAADFEAPSGYSLTAMMERIHFYNGQQMLVGFPATLAYWRLGGPLLSVVARLFSLPGLFHLADFAYNRWAAWRMRGQNCEPR